MQAVPDGAARYCNLKEKEGMKPFFNRFIEDDDWRRFFLFGVCSLLSVLGLLGVGYAVLWHTTDGYHASTWEVFLPVGLVVIAVLVSYLRKNGSVLVVFPLLLVYFAYRAVFTAFISDHRALYVVESVDALPQESRLGDTYQVNHWQPAAEVPGVTIIKSSFYSFRIFRRAYDVYLTWPLADASSSDRCWAVSHKRFFRMADARRFARSAHTSTFRSCYPDGVSCFRSISDSQEMVYARRAVYSTGTTAERVLTLYPSAEPFSASFSWGYLVLAFVLWLLAAFAYMMARGLKE